MSTLPKIISVTVKTRKCVILDFSIFEKCALWHKGGRLGRMGSVNGFLYHPIHSILTVSTTNMTCSGLAYKDFSQGL